MPWTLYRYILRELLKLLVLSAGVLVMVISFVAAIKPMSDGMLGPVTLLKFVLYTIPTMLGFVLPFAGAFSSTLVFIRMATDNEITACATSGMSYRKILLPVLMLGLALTMGLFYLSNFVVPRYYRLADRTIQRDLVTLLVSQLNQSRPFVFPNTNFVLYADHADIIDPDRLTLQDPAPEKVVDLRGVAVGQLDLKGRLRSDTTAQRALVFLYRQADTNRSWVMIRLENAMYYDVVRGELSFVGSTDIGPVRLPSPFHDDPKFLSLHELKVLGQNPERYDQVNEATQHLARILAVERLRFKIAQALKSQDIHGALELAGVQEGDQFFLQCPKAYLGTRQITLRADEAQPVQIEYATSGQVLRRYEAQKALIQVEQSEFSIEPTVVIQLYETKVYDTRSLGRYSEHPVLNLQRAMWPQRILESDPKRLRAESLRLQTEHPPYNKISTIISARTSLADEIVHLGNKIMSQLNQRAANAVACLLLLLLGGVLSIQLKGQMPLVVYFWSFLLAIISIVIIYTGGNMASNAECTLSVGLLILWTGNLMLLAVLFALFYRL